MAHLSVGEYSSGGDYSESFELDDTDSRESSSLGHEQADVLARFRETLASDEDHPPHRSHSATGSKQTRKPPTPKGGGRSRVDLGRTVRSPIAMSQHLQQGGQLTNENSQDNPSLAPPLSSPPLHPTGHSLTFREATGKVQKLQAAVKKFKNSDEMREVAFKEWLAKKEVKDMRSKKATERCKKMDEETKRNEEVKYST